MYVIAKVFIAKEPREIQTKTGTKMVSAFGFCDISGDSGLPVGIVAFGNLADVLAKYRKGATIRVTGSFQANNWTNAQGEEQHGFKITADGIAGVKHATG